MMLLFLIAVAFAYYFDFKQNKKTFKDQAKGGVFLLIGVIALYFILKYIFVEYNNYK